MGHQGRGAGYARNYYVGEAAQRRSEARSGVELRYWFFLCALALSALPMIPGCATENNIRESVLPQSSSNEAATQSTAAMIPILPDSTRHPGAMNPDVTSENLDQTICANGFTKGIRPPDAYTSALKSQQLADESLPGNPSDYEEDHLISLELGGATRDPKNLWPEPWEKRGSKLANPGTGAESKDKVENETNHLVCSGALPLSDAQARIASDWHQLGVDEGVL